jgi:deoxycytidylate deaminase
VEVAHSSDYKQRHGAVLYRRGKVISIGYNQKKTHPKAQRFYEFPYLHAEMHCLVRADEDDATNASIACVRINRNGDLMNSKPCPACMSAMKSYGISYVVYSYRDGTTVKESI